MGQYGTISLIIPHILPALGCMDPSETFHLITIASQNNDVQPTEKLCRKINSVNINDCPVG